MAIGLISLDATIQEMKTVRFYKDLFCEALVTFMFMTALTQASMNFGDSPEMRTFIRSTVGLFVMALIESYGHINFALFNPNLVIAFMITQRLSIPKGILYIAIEIFSGTGAASMVNAITPANVTDLLTPPSAVEGINIGSAWACELIACNFFTGVLIGALDEKRKPVNIPHLAVGFAVTAATTVGAPYGICLNPVVSFALCFVTGTWDNAWVYWTAGPVGAIVGPAFYHFFAYDVGTCAKIELTAKEDYDLDGNINKGFTDENNIAIISSQLRLQDLQMNNVSNIRQMSPLATVTNGTNNNNPYKRDY